jgi:predicted nucleic acid-binding Zn ribbon protein
MKRRESEQVGDVIRKFLRQEGLETPLNEFRIVDAWKDVVGAGIANYTQQIYVKNQTLYVHLTSPVLRQELMMTRQILVRRLNEKVRAQVITDIVFR